MTTKNFLTIVALIALAYGLAFLFIPEEMGRIYGMQIVPPVILQTRFFGTTLLAVGLIAWLVRNTRDREVLNGVVTALAISNAVGIGVSSWGTLSGIMSEVGWSATAIYALLLIGCLISRPE